LKEIRIEIERRKKVLRKTGSTGSIGQGSVQTCFGSVHLLVQTGSEHGVGGVNGGVRIY
jgi:hypothetical protein